MAQANPAPPHEGALQRLAGGGTTGTTSECDTVGRLARELLVKGGVPGLALAIVRNGAASCTLAAGVANGETATPVVSGTVFEAASLGKPVFAYAVLRLSERGEFDLDRSLPDYLPNPDVRNDERIRHVTARRVLCHTAGFPNWRRGKDLALEFEPGEKFGYSGEGYAYLQKVIESVTGVALDDFVRKEVFAPLQMVASSFVWREAYDTIAATGHDYLQQPGKKEKPTKGNAAASLHTTASDYARFIVEVLRPTLLKPAAVQAMLKGQIEVQKDVSWGLGWGLERAGDRSFFWHWGDNETFRGFVIGDRVTGDGLVLLTNGENGLSIAEPIVAAVFPGTHPAFAWLDYDRYDSPARTIRERLVRAGVANGEHGIYKTFSELERTYPKEAFTESLLNRVGYELLAKKRAGAAVEVLQRNVRLYPKSWNVYDSLAEAYVADGDFRLAIQFYEKSLKLNPDNENAKVALRQLKEARHH